MALFAKYDETLNGKLQQGLKAFDDKAAEMTAWLDATVQATVRDLQYSQCVSLLRLASCPLRVLRHRGRRSTRMLSADS